jgi:DNA-binding NarL/FixJ family response regulator
MTVKLTVLIADDHPGVRAGLQALLADRLELRVVGEAENGAVAVAQARALQPDVIVMDVSMPDLDGVEATRIILAALPHIQIVGVSTQERGSRPHAIERAGAIAYFAKGDDMRPLVDYLLDLSVRAGKPPDGPH